MIVLLSLLLSATSAYAQQWRQLEPTGTAPTPRNNASLVYDPVGHRLIVFAGRSSAGDLNDLWSLDIETLTWTQLHPSGSPPPPRSTHNAVYDPATQQMLVWSGRLSSVFYNDVWALDLAQTSWIQFEPEGPVPNTRYGTGAIFDPSDRQLVTFAGFTDEGRFDDTWTFTPTTSTWTNLGLTVNPGRRCLHTASYDPQRHRMIIYGGQRSGALGDLWSLDLNARVWSELTPAISPEGRTFPASVYDEHGQRFIIFGGGGANGLKHGDTWSYDFVSGTWEQIALTGTSPIARNGAAGVYIERESRSLFFGGVGTEVRFNDVWALEGLAPPPPPTAVETTSWGKIKGHAAPEANKTQ